MEKGGPARRPAAVGTVLAPGNPGGASLAYPLGNASALVAGCGLHLYIRN